ncbi:DUF7576 family protein [Haloarchaeobius litoreus]|uniref:Small CPxCG-related zinc finger protein n=1 Tax=Haloarchaeobius litoreus TaxID=755306 RepID=A0ABD6DMK6_9EURY|nr:hypothetical protein [Haloarchaeobius litoreus]
MTSAEPEAVSASEDTEATCATCGAPVETDEWHPAASTKRGDGAVQILSFCDHSCRDRWQERAE